MTYEVTSDRENYIYMHLLFVREGKVISWCRKIRFPSTSEPIENADAVNQVEDVVQTWGSQFQRVPSAKPHPQCTQEMRRDDGKRKNRKAIPSSIRAGLDDGKYGLIGGSSIVDPMKHTIAEAKETVDEVVVAEINLAICRHGDKAVRRLQERRKLVLPTGSPKPIFVC